MEGMELVQFDSAQFEHSMAAHLAGFAEGSAAGAGGLLGAQVVVRAARGGSVGADDTLDRILGSPRELTRGAARRIAE